MVKDLNLLRIFEALWLDRSVTKAAKRLHLSQPALSHALGRLRLELGDDLFVRSGKGVTPTPRAQFISETILEALLHLDRSMARMDVFSPTKAKGRITIVGTDLIEYTLFPRLLKLFASEAPHVVLVSRTSNGLLPKTEMERGDVDFAIAGFFGEIPEGFYQQKVASESYKTLVRKKHPFVKDSLDIETFSKLRHVLTSPQGDLWSVVDAALEKKGLKRSVSVGVTTFQVIGKLVAESDCCATLPSTLAKDQALALSLNLYEPPVRLDPIQLYMIWHQRVHSSPLHSWVRTQIQSILKDVFDNR